MPAEIKRRFKIFIEQSSKMKALIMVSFILTGLMRFLILIMPFRRITALMGKESHESPPSLDESSYVKVKKVGWAVNAVSSHTPWQSKCLVKALTAQFILKALRIPSTLYLGVTKDSKNKIIAHAWVRSGEHIVTGDFEAQQFKSITCFSS